MEILGTPGGPVWVRATIHIIQISEAGVFYYVKLPDSGQAFEFKAEDVRICADSEKDPEKDPEKKREENLQTEETPAEVMAKAAKKKRGRPRKATVEDLLQRAEDVRSQKIYTPEPDTPADYVHELVKKDDLKEGARKDERK